MYILQTVFHTFPKVLTRRILFNNQGLLGRSHNGESDIHVSYCDSVSLMFLQCKLLNPLTSKISLATLLTSAIQFFDVSLENLDLDQPIIP